MSTRRSVRVRGTADEDHLAANNNLLDDVDVGGLNNTSASPPRKRTRLSRDRTVEADTTGGVGGTSAASGATQEGALETEDLNGSPSKRGTGRPRGRPPKHAANASIEEGGASDDVVNTNGGGGGGLRETRNTRSGNADDPTNHVAGAEVHIHITDIKQEGEESGHELFLEDEHREALLAVLDQFAPELLRVSFTAAEPTSPVKSRGKKKGPSSSTPSNLSEALDGRPITLRKLRSLLLAIRQPVLGIANGATQDEGPAKAEGKRRLTASTVVLSLLDEIAQSARQQQHRQGLLPPPSVASSAVKQEERADVLDELLDGRVDTDAGGDADSTKTAAALAPHKYALHMRLPVGDYFSQAVELTPEQAAKIDTGAADLVEIEPPPPPPTFSKRDIERHMAAKAVPTLGSQRSRQASLHAPSDSIEELRERRMGRIRPTRDVYFGPYASFAPTYDSNDSNISREATSLVWRTKMDPIVCASRKAWGLVKSSNSGIDGEDTEDEDDWEVIDAAEASAADDPAATAAASALDLDPSLDAELIASFIASRPSNEEIAARLRSNAGLLDQLQEYQWARLRSGHARWKALQKEQSSTTSSQRGRRRLPDVPEDRPSEEEQTIARNLLQGLTDLIGMRPRGNGSKAQERQLLPDDAALHTLSQSVAIDPALSAPDNANSRPGYWGTMDQSSTSASRSTRTASGRSGGGSIVVPTLQSNTSVRLDAKGENASHTRRINSSRSGGLPPGISVDAGGPGLLDRVMSVMGRQVAHQASISAAVAPPPQPQQQQQQPHAATNAMSPPPTKAGGMMPPPVPGALAAGAGAGIASSPPPNSSPMSTRRSYAPPARQ